MARKKRRRKVNIGKFLGFIGFSIFFLYFSYTFIQQGIQISNNNKYQENQAEEMEQINQEIQRLEGELEKVEDHEYIEDLARKKLNMVYPDDVIYVDKDLENSEEITEDQ